MYLSKPSFLSLTNGEESVFLAWSSVINATQYAIEVKTNDNESRGIYNTTGTSILIKNLENSQAYVVKVTAINEDVQSEPSISYVVMPKLRPSLCTLKAIRGERAGSVHLRWTATSTDFGFTVERCDVGQIRGYKTIAWLSDNTVVTYEDQTDCPTLEQRCYGHYYTVRYRDSAWWHGAGILSKKVFCMLIDDSYCNNDIQTDDLLQDKRDESSIE